MSELIAGRASRTNFRWQLLATVSALTLFGGSGFCAALAADDDANSPTVWVEFGGQLERVDGTGDRFVPPFLQGASMSGPFAPVSPIDAQTAPRYTYGGEGKISFEPESSNWAFSAALRYGRSNGKKHVHYQTVLPVASKYLLGRHSPVHSTLANFADTRAKQYESHAVLDFQAGKDVGLGIFGHGSNSTFSMGVRFAQFTSRQSATIYARSDLQWYDRYPDNPNKYVPNAKFHAFTAISNVKHSFQGLGPSLSWDASSPLMGDADSAEVTFDWGLNGAVLFGRQKTTAHHQTTDRYFRNVLYNHPLYPGGSIQSHYNGVYAHSADPARSRSVVVPNLGGFAGVSLKFPNAKVSFGYRADMFFGAVDSGIDARKSQNMGFYGPFASIAIGLGG